VKLWIAPNQRLRAETSQFYSFTVGFKKSGSGSGGVCSAICRRVLAAQRETEVIVWVGTAAVMFFIGPALILIVRETAK
jgi:hypothetical protein